MRVRQLLRLLEEHDPDDFVVVVVTHRNRFGTAVRLVRNAEDVTLRSTHRLGDESARPTRLVAIVGEDE